MEINIVGIHFIKYGMKKNRMIIPLIMFFLITTFSCFAQQDECTVLYPSDSSEKIVINRDTLFFQNNLGRKIYFFNNNVYLNHKIIHKFKNVNWYAEFTFVKIKAIDYIYIYPIYDGQVGPYVWELHNGIAFRIDKMVSVAKDIPYSEPIEICDLQLDKYFSKKRLVKSKNKQNG